MENLALPKLNALSPTLDSTLLKMMEEIGELSEQLELLEEGEGSISSVAEELLDLAQTVITLMFVFEKEGIRVQEWLDDHIEKLIEKKYLKPERRDEILLKSDGKYQYISLPQLNISGVTLDKTLRNINKAMGRLAQARGKFRGMNGENCMPKSSEVNKIMGLALLHVAQCCYTMMYVLKNQYGVNIKEIVERHLEKLERKGYLSSKVS
ncbi:MAG: hypothetical protein PWQ96_701 [Clostridia bacterium]|jgi:NTP pyrophosphatase (non-canonical NTP hydrolase)|nr:hypothetical protein [Clostridiales bacterium]MDK2985059.1 hypothetical protein [Clostridia bacterium]